MYDHFDMYSLRSAPPEMDDNTGLMPPDSNASSSNSASATDDGPSTSSQEQQQRKETVNPSNSEMIGSFPVTRSTASVSDMNIAKVSAAWPSNDGSDTEILTQADHRDLQPGTRTEVSPLMKMALSRAAPDNDDSPASKKVCQAGQSSSQTGRLGILYA